MSITFIAGALRKALRAAGGIVEKRYTIPVLGCIVVRADGKEATIEATDLDRVLRWRLDCSGEGEFVVPFAPLAAIIRHLGDGEMVRIGAAPDNRVRVDFGDGRASFMSLPIADWPSIGEMTGDVTTLAMPPCSLTDLAAFISTEETRYYLNGVFIEIGIETVRAVATNGHALGVIRDAATRKDDGDGGGFIVPRYAVEWISAHARDVESLSAIFTTTKASFAADRFTLVTKLIDGRYPDWQRVVPAAETPTLLTVDADGFARKLARLRALGGRHAGLSYDGKRIVGSASGPDGETMSLAFGGKTDKPFDLEFRPDPLSDGLRFVGGQVTIKSGGAGDPLRVEGDGTRIAVVMPARAGMVKHDLPEDIAA